MRVRSRVGVGVVWLDGLDCWDRCGGVSVSAQAGTYSIRRGVRPFVYKMCLLLISSYSNYQSL
jgi:hypothetical protein